jgi:hypothetical protein
MLKKAVALATVLGVSGLAAMPAGAEAPQEITEINQLFSDYLELDSKLLSGSFYVGTSAGVKALKVTKNDVLGTVRGGYEFDKSFGPALGALEGGIQFSADKSYGVNSGDLGAKVVLPLALGEGKFAVVLRGGMSVHPVVKTLGQQAIEAVETHISDAKETAAEVKEKVQDAASDLQAQGSGSVQTNRAYFFGWTNNIWPGRQQQTTEETAEVGKEETVVEEANKASKALANSAKHAQEFVEKTKNSLGGYGGIGLQYTATDNVTFEFSYQKRFLPDSQGNNDFVFLNITYYLN